MTQSFKEQDKYLMSLLNTKTLTKALLHFFLPPSHMSKNFADIIFPVLSVIKKKGNMSKNDYI